MLTPNPRRREALPTEGEDTLFLPGLSPVAGKGPDVRFDGGDVSSDGGLLVPRGHCSRGERGRHSCATAVEVRHTDEPSAIAAGGRCRTRRADRHPAVTM